MQVSIKKEYKERLIGYLFDSQGNLIERAPVREGRLQLKSGVDQVRSGRLFIGPQLPEGTEEQPTLSLMERTRAYEPVLQRGFRREFIDVIRVPDDLIDFWNLCFCWVKGRVLKSPGDGPVCGAKVHICEVDRLWIFRLPDLDIIRLRDDLLRAIMTRPPFPPPPPGDPFRDLVRSPLRFQNPIEKAGLNPQPLPPKSLSSLSSLQNPGSIKGFDPQPDPPGLPTRMFQAASFQPSLNVSQNVLSALNSSSISAIRDALANNLELIRPYFCLWPWWWWWLTCDEIRVLETDEAGRFETLLIYPCSGDKPDLYFWVEYQIGSSWETVYRPPIACNTYWDYACGTEVTLRVTDPRVPTCDPDPNLPGKQVAVLSIGNEVSVDEIQGPGSGLTEGLTTSGEPFGGVLEPHVWFSRETLIASGVTHYRWSFRRLTGPDGIIPNVTGWTIMTRTVGRHYVVVNPITSDLSFPFEPLGPDGLNLFRIKPVDPPAPGIEWFQVDAREDSATAFFETQKLPHGLPGTPTECQKAEVTAGKYEIKLELFRADGTLVNWTAEGIDLKIADVPAPFGTGTVTTINAPAGYRILDGSGNTLGFRMTLRVDNNCCEADIFPLSGAGLTVDVNCGFIEYNSPMANALISFLAKHPNNFATFSFNTTRGLGTNVPEATTAGTVGAASTPASAGGPFGLTPPFTYSKNVSVDTLLTTNTPVGMTPCSRAAFAETLYIAAMATDGWTRLSYLDRSDVAAFALDTPCPECD